MATASLPGNRLYQGASVLLSHNLLVPAAATGAQLSASASLAFIIGPPIVSAGQTAGSTW